MTVNIHTPPNSTTASSLYTVTVNGSAARCYYTPAGSFANFSTDQDVTISVTFNTTITTAVLTPQRKNIKLNVSGNNVTFTLSGDDKNGQYILRINDPNYTDDAQTPTWEPLFIYANPLEISPPVADGTDLKYVGPGDWYVSSSTTIAAYTGVETVSDNYYDIAQNKTLYLHGNAVLRGKVKFGSDSNVGAGTTLGTLKGRGILDSRFTASWGRPIRINHSSNITLDGFVAIGQFHWAVAFRQSNTCTANNIKVINYRHWDGAAMTGTPDGIDCVASSNITVTNSFVRSYDDSITVKSDQAGGGWAQTVDNIKYENIVIYQMWGGNAMEIGYEVPQNITNVSFKNIDVIKNSRSSGPTTRDAISIFAEQGGDVTGVTYENIYVEGAHPNYIGIVSNNTNSAITNVSYKNIVFYGQPAEKNVEIDGFSATGNVAGVTFENIRFGGPGGKTVSSMSEMTLIPAGSDASNYRAYSVSRTSNDTNIPLGAFNILHINVSENVENILRFRYTGSQSSVAPRFSVASADGVFRQAGTAVFSTEEIIVTLANTESSSDLAYYRLELADRSNVVEAIGIGYIKMQSSPISSYNIGNISGASINPSLGGLQYATLTGNGAIQILTAGAKFGDKLVLRLTQDATGTRVPTWGSNVKNASNLVLSTGANKVDVLSYIFDGTYWRESSRSLNQS